MSRYRTECDEFEGAEVVKSTRDAVCVRVPGVEEEVWLPRSTLGEANECETEGDVGLLVVQARMARQKGLS